jgi:FMN reductase
MRVVGIGGSTRESSSTELLIRSVLRVAEEQGAETRLFAGPALILPPYEPHRPLPRRARALIEAVRGADALVFGSPGYHGTLSGLVKNALDYLEELSGDERPYVDGLPVACVVTASGWQAAVNTLRALRETVHALRGWPTPLGLAVNVAGGLTDPETGAFRDPRLEEQARAVATQLLGFARSAADAATGVNGADAAALVAEQLRRAIAVGRFGPGARVPSARAIAEQLGVTAETARQGIDRLVDARVLVRSGGSTAVASGVFERDAQAGERGLAEFLELLEVREALETAAARLAAERRSEEDVSVLRGALARVHESRRERGAAAVARFAHADGALHAALAAAARNGHLERAIADARARMFLPIGAVFAQIAPRADDQHDAIVEAIEARDPDAAEAAMRAHLDATRADVRQLVTWQEPVPA